MAGGLSTGDAEPANGKKVVDMRSDTVTKPTEAMYKAMVAAEVGDDVFGDDPTVLALQAHVAELLGKEAGLFVPTGTMGNLIAVGVHCSGRGEEVITGRDSHMFFYEQGGASWLMGAVFNLLPNQPDGTLDLEAVRLASKNSEDAHHARAKLLSLENTQNRMGGKVLSLEYMAQASALCKELGMLLHIDGARLWNAAAKLGVPPADLCKGADTVTVCLSKALGAPVGSVLVGSAEFIRSAKRLRKALGGGMRQAGVLAAAGIYAVDNHRERLVEDHANAQHLGEGLAELGLKVIPAATNMVFWEVDNAPELTKALVCEGFKIMCQGPRRLRAIPNLHTTREDVENLVKTIRMLLEGGGHGPPPPKKAKMA